MASDPAPINKIFLTLQSNGNLVLDKDYLWKGCDTPELDPSIDMEPVSIRKLAKLLRERHLEWPELEQAENLKTLLTELKVSTEIIEDTIAQITAKAPK